MGRVVSKRNCIMVGGSRLEITDFDEERGEYFLESEDGAVYSVPKTNMMSAPDTAIGRAFVVKDPCTKYNAVRLAFIVHSGQTEYIEIPFDCFNMVKEPSIEVNRNRLGDDEIQQFLKLEE